METNQPQADISAIRKELLALVLEMSTATTEEEAKRGMERLRGIRSAVEAANRGKGLSDQIQRELAEQLAWLELRLRRLREVLARKRLYQQGEAMAKQAQQAADAGLAQGPALLLPKLPVDPVVKKTVDKDAKPEALPAAGQQLFDAAPEPQEEPREEKQPEEAPKKPEPKAEKPKPPEPKAEKDPVWTKAERLTAHLAASLGENAAFFEELRRASKGKGHRKPAPEDDREAETHYRTIHNLGRRVVNLELHCRAIVQAVAKGEPLARLLRTGARELGSFLQDYRAAREAMPDQASEYDRLFGGYVKALTAMKPEKGERILAQAQAEAKPSQRKPEPEAPQLVLRRDENWN